MHSIGDVSGALSRLDVRLGHTVAHVSSGACDMYGLSGNQRQAACCAVMQRLGSHFLTAEPRRSRRKKWPLSTNSWWMGSHRTWLRKPYLHSTHAAAVNQRHPALERGQTPYGWRVMPQHRGSRTILSARCVWSRRQRTWDAGGELDRSVRCARMPLCVAACMGEHILGCGPQHAVLRTAANIDQRP